jgi:spermidine/putrescine transport system ATP-binding protein
MALLEIRNVTRRFGALTAIDNVSIDIEAGEFFTLLGPSGCGKTTLLRMIAGFDQPDSGTISLDGKDMADTPPEQRPIHTVFQSYALFPHMMVADNIAFPLRMAGKSADEIAAKVREMLDIVHLPDKADHFPHELSGGQKQRVALARSLVNRPRMLLLDEPLGALDAKLREEMQVELISLQRDIGITFVFVTHSQAEALALSHRIAVMNAGRVEQLDAPSRIYGFPKNRFVADFIGNCNLLDARVQTVSGNTLMLESAGLGTFSAPAREGIVAGARGVLALRPEMVQIFASGAPGDPELSNRFHGAVKELVYVGNVTTYMVTLDNGLKIETLLPNSGSGRVRFFEIGDSVQIAWRPDAGHFVVD